MLDILKILTSKLYASVIILIYIATVVITGSNGLSFDYEVLYKYDKNYGVFLLYFLLFLLIICYIWDKINKRKGKGNGTYKYKHT